MLISENTLSNAAMAVFIFQLTPLSLTQLNNFAQYVKASLKEKSFYRKKHCRLELGMHVAESF
jgi:hypothetical protein